MRLPLRISASPLKLRMRNASADAPQPIRNSRITPKYDRSMTLRDNLRRSVLKNPLEFAVFEISAVLDSLSRTDTGLESDEEMIRSGLGLIRRRFDDVATRLVAMQATEVQALPVSNRYGLQAEGVARRFRDRFPTGVSWGVTAWMFVMHIGAIAAFWFFTWQGLALLVGLHFVTACLGITLGYHRLLTHGSLIVPRPVKYFFSICGMLSAEGSPLMWVATHRKHHVHSDHDDDPHSPNHGFWWSHMLWFAPADTPEELDALLQALGARSVQRPGAAVLPQVRSDCIR